MVENINERQAPSKEADRTCPYCGAVISTDDEVKVGNRTGCTYCTTVCAIHQEAEFSNEQTYYTRIVQKIVGHMEGDKMVGTRIIRERGQVCIDCLDHPDVYPDVINANN